MTNLSERERLNQSLLLDEAERVAIQKIRAILVSRLSGEPDRFNYFGYQSAIRAIDLMEPVADADGSVCMHTTMVFTHGTRLRSPALGVKIDELPRIITIAARGGYPRVLNTLINIKEFTPRRLDEAIGSRRRAWFIVMPKPSVYYPPAHIIGARIDRGYDKMQIWDSQSDRLYSDRTGLTSLFSILDMGELHSRLRRFHGNREYPIRVVAF